MKRIAMVTPWKVMLLTVILATGLIFTMDTEAAKVVSRSTGSTEKGPGILQEAVGLQEEPIEAEQTGEAVPEEETAAAQAEQQEQMGIEEFEPLQPQLEESQPQPPGREIDPNRPMIALTFDDGPYGPVDNQIMDSLAQHGGKATFYVVGNRCSMYPAVMQRMVAEGHEVGNHTYEHKILTKLNTSQIRYQVDKGREAIIAATGVAPATVRLPGGSKNATVLAAVQEPILMWSVDTLDWKTKNTQSTINKVVGQVKDGDVVLMHDLYAQTGAAAAQIIPALVEQGFQLVTVSELAQYRGGLANGGVYSRFRP